MQISRRSFVGTGAAAIGSIGMAAKSANAQTIYKHGDWKSAEFEDLIKSTAQVKQLFDARAIADGQFLNAIKNSLNGLYFGFEVPADQIRIVSCMHGPANLLNFNDSMWAKYRIGEYLKVNDQQTGKPAVRNVFFPKRKNFTSTDTEDHTSIYQDTSIEALQSRGVKFLSCHNATNVQARGIVESFSLQVTPEDMVKDLQSHTLPGVLIVPAMVAAIALLQSEGHFSYISG